MRGLILLVKLVNDNHVDNIKEILVFVYHGRL